MTADELLTKLGYVKIADNYKTIIYQKRFDNEPYYLTKIVTFYTRDNDISIEFVNWK